jgi:hypothetical protein
MTELHEWVKSRILFSAGGLITPTLIYMVFRSLSAKLLRDRIALK